MKALALTYRPTTFDDVVEQGSTITILKNQIETNTFKHAYLFAGSAGCGKTTCARIFANEINNHQGNPIEMDAASNNSVEDVRNIIQQAKSKSLDSEYKVFIIDECLTGDTEILTSDGFKRFDALIGNEIVAQYCDNGTIEFVKPSKFIKMEYKGNLKVWNPRNWCTVRMTPNHIQPLHYVKSNKVKECYAKDLKFNQAKELIVSGMGIGDNSFSAVDRLAIVCQADGTLQHTSDNATHWLVGFKKQRKIDRFLKLCECAGINPNEIKSNRDDYHRYTFDMPLDVSKMLNTHFSLDMGYEKARAFIDEVKNWDGYVGDNYLYYSSKIKDNVDFVSAVATLGGYSSRVRECDDDRKETYSKMYRLYMYDTEYVNCQHIQKTYHDEYFDGYVYCVKVPSHKIIIRVDGFTFITGNCHSISSTGWQAMLKLIEEPPAKSIFIFCTTDPQKIPKTILSRVQRYDFTKISYASIVDRLKYICESESIDYEIEALEYIAKLADGGMRDSITMLDKCVSYAEFVSVDNVVKALGVADYETMFAVCDSFVYADTEKLINRIEKVYNSGADLKQFVKQLLSFCLDISKYKFTKSFEFINLPETEENKSILSEFTDYDFEGYSKMLKILVKLNADIKWETNPKTLVEAVLLSEVE